MFHHSILDPLKEDPISMGPIEKDSILPMLDKFPWRDMLNRMKGVDDGKLFWSPSIEFENLETKKSVTVSIVEYDTGKIEYYIFYRRPKQVSLMFGLIQRFDQHHTTDRTGQTFKDAREAVIALLSNDEKTLETRWG